MAAIWVDITGATNNVTMTNTHENLMFHWLFVTFSGEVQETAEIRWRKCGASLTILERMKYEGNTWSTPISVGMRSTGDRIDFVQFPIDTFSEGVWIFQVRFKIVGSGDWSGWYAHKVEISPYSDRQDFVTSSPAATKDPAFPNEGEYGVKVEVMSAAGIVAESAEVTFDVWDTTKYSHTGGVVQAVPEHYHTGTTVGRIKRS